MVIGNPQSVMIMFIQFILGAALGYIAVKALKYILAFILILVLGAFLSIWSLGATPQEVLGKLGVTIEALKGIAYIVGLMMIGPVAVGFIVGLLLAILLR